MPAAEHRLPLGEEPARRDQVQVILGAGHGELAVRRWIWAKKPRPIDGGCGGRLEACDSLDERRVPRGLLQQAVRGLRPAPP
jgi:hypothetical protein